MAAHSLAQRFTGVGISVLRRSAETAAVGIIFRNREGEVVRKVSYSQDAASVDAVAFDAVLWVLDIAAAHGQRSVVVYLDSPHLVDQLSNRAKVPAALRSQFVQIRCRANALGRVRFQLAAGEKTFAARRLAQAAVVGGPAKWEETKPGTLAFAFAKDLAV